MARKVVVCLAVVMMGHGAAGTARSSIPREWNCQANPSEPGNCGQHYFT